jgi:iron complex outermembrane receptor protein
MTQRLRSDDRIAFPYGCYDASYYACDLRPLPDGSFDLWDFRSENERRRSDALDLGVQGRQLAPACAPLAAGLLLDPLPAALAAARPSTSPAPAASTAASVPPPELNDENTNRDERSTELYLRDAMQSGPAWQLWAGLRHTRLHRESVRTDGSRATDYERRFTTPWLALSHESPQHIVYASWGRGIESDVAPNRAATSTAGKPLPALKSRQWESGSSTAASASDCRLTLLRHPPRPDRRHGAPATRRGRFLHLHRRLARHRGLEGELAGSSWGPCAWQGSAMWLRAEREGSADPAVNGQRPTNVPGARLKAGGYTSPSLPGLALQAPPPCTKAAAWCCPTTANCASPAGPAWTPRPALAALTGWPTTPDLARRHRQPRRPPRLARSALPVRPCLPVPAGTAQLCTLSVTIEPVTDAGISGYTARLNSPIAQSVERRTVNP